MTTLRHKLIFALLQTIVAACVGGLGIWQRNQILNKPFFEGQTLRDTTAAFHVWPWPYKFAAIYNLPAVLGTGLLLVPTRLLWKNAPGLLDVTISLLLVFSLWYWVGAHVQLSWRSIALLGAFATAALVGAFLPLGYSGFLPFGVLLWLLVIPIARHRSFGTATRDY
jgi:hypothetical protein